MIRETELYLIRNLELFRFKQMDKEWQDAEIAYARLKQILEKHKEIDNEGS